MAIALRAGLSGSHRRASAAGLISEIPGSARAASARVIPNGVNERPARFSLSSSRFAFLVNLSSQRDLTAKKVLVGFPKFEVGHIPSQARCGTAAGFLIPGVLPDLHAVATAGRVKILTSPFPEDVHLKAWAARMIAAADEFQRNKRPDPLGGFVLR